METVKLGFDMARQLNLLLYSLIIGAFLGAFFDVMRISRVFLSTLSGERSSRFASGLVVSIVAFFEDIIFFAVFAITTVLFCFQANGGSTRGFILFGMLGGFSLYILTIGRLTKLISKTLSRFLYQILAFILNRMIIPILTLIRRAAIKIYQSTIGRAFEFVTGVIHRNYTEKSSRELNRFCSRQFID